MNGRQQDFEAREGSPCPDPFRVPPPATERAWTAGPVLSRGAAPPVGRDGETPASEWEAYLAERLDVHTEDGRQPSPPVSTPEAEDAGITPRDPRG